jgi:hypothetical protein
MSRDGDPDQMADGIRQLAATSDEELARGIQVAAAELVARIDGCPVLVFTPAAAAAVDRVRQVAGELSNDASVRALVDAVGPVLGMWWPDHPPEVQPVRAAVEALRTAAMTRPSLVRDARWITSTGRPDAC